MNSSYNFWFPYPSSSHPSSSELRNSSNDFILHPSQYSYDNFPSANNSTSSSLLVESDESFIGDNRNSNSIHNLGRPSMCKEEENDSRNGENQMEIQTKRRRRNTKITFGVRSSPFRGVSKYEGGRYEAFLWDNTEAGKKGKTVYIGGFKKEVEAARAHDLAALKFWGTNTALNFPEEQYSKEWEEMQHMTKNEYLIHIRRKSASFAKGASNYRGVSRNTDNNRWQAKLGKGRGGFKGIYLGTFDCEKKAARAYDVAVIKMKGHKAATNFDINDYDVEGIVESAKFRIGKGASNILRWCSVFNVLRNKKDFDYEDQPTTIPQSFSFGPPIHQIQQTQNGASPNQQYVDPFLLHALQKTDIQNNQLLQYCNFNPSILTNPNFNNWVGANGGVDHLLGNNEGAGGSQTYAGGVSGNNFGGAIDQMEPFNQFGPVITPPQGNCDAFGHEYLNQNPNSFYLAHQGTQVPTYPPTISPSFVPGFSSLDTAGPSYIGESSGSMAPEASLPATVAETNDSSCEDMISNELLQVGGDDGEVVFNNVLEGSSNSSAAVMPGNGEIGNPFEDVGVDKSGGLLDSDDFPLSWLEKFLMGSDESD